MERPNILFLMSDEHRATVAGFEGNQIVETPLLDELAETGVVFRNCYTPSPITVPTMQCLMAGQLPKTCGCEGWLDLKPGHLTWARLFSQYAYETCACGRLVHQGPDMMQGWTTRIGNDMQMSIPYIANRQEDEFARYIRPFADYKWSDAKEIKRAGVGRARNVTTDEYTTIGALQFIENYYVDPYYDREQPNRPLILRVGMLQPHYPYSADESKFKYYLNHVEPYLKQKVFDHPFLSQRQVQPGVDASEREIRRATAAYYAMIQTIDEHFSRVLDALYDAGQNPDDWIIVYCSDHGEMLGEHGIWEKQKFFEGSARVPLIIRWPKRIRGGRVIQQNVSLCDIYATLCELAGLPIPPGLDSRSLVPLLDGKKKVAWNNEAVSQFGATNVMIKRDQYKYQYYGPDMPEVLFDLKSDPHEAENLISDSGYIQQVEAFRARLAELGHGPNAKSDYVNAGYK
jgi:choline-sulfatase